MSGIDPVKVVFRWPVVIPFLLTVSIVSASTIKKDEVVVFFPTAAFLDTVTGKWSVPVHGWIYEPEETSVWRSALVEELLGWLELRAGSVDKKVFRRRARMFLVDNERGKRLTIKVAGTSVETLPSGPNGHFRQSIALDKKVPGDLPPGAWLHVMTDQAETGAGRYTGRTQLVGPVGLSVISDIDDTIKVSNVLDKPELLENTFLRKFKPVHGMSELYRKWERSGVVFHYVSGSPWQLYPALEEFISTAGFPDGSVSLRDFRIKDRTFFNLFTSPQMSKTPSIELLLNRYPERKFTLVGDSGEKDPEIYGALARRYPDQVIRICIRNVPGSESTSDRYRAAFKGLDETVWTVFGDPGELEGISLD